MSAQTFLDVSFMTMDSNCLEDFLVHIASPISPLSTPTTSPGVSGRSPTSHGLDQAGPSRSTPSPPAAAAAPACDTSRKRVRPKIDLAPGQPPTARGNPRIRVFVACYQCRARKIRCDGAKPICCNCQKRPSEAEQCNFDSGPNRRGRDKRGVRDCGSQQSARRTRSPQKDVNPPLPDPDVAQDVVHSGSEQCPPVDGLLIPEDELLDFADELSWELDPILYDVGSSTDISRIRGTSDVVTSSQTNDQNEEQEESIPSRPGAQFARDTWWDALLTFYATERELGEGKQVVSLSPAQRSAAMKGMMVDLKALLQSSPCWLSFINLPRFFDTLFNPMRRRSLQPSLLFSALALGTLSQSSEVERGARGRRKALRLLEMAHSALEGSLATGWVDIGLAQAAVLIVFFEMQSHPEQSLERSRSAIRLLDSLFRLFSLTSVDEGIKARGRSPYEVIRSTARNAFNPAVQMGFIPHPQYIEAQDILVNNTAIDHAVYLTDRLFNYLPPHGHSGAHAPPKRGCNCDQFSLGQKWPSVRNVAPSWSVAMMWPEGLSEGQFRREECRRLVWSSVMVISNMNMYTSADPASLPVYGKVFVREPENFALMFPGEALAATGAEVEADDIWSLNMRTMLLSHVCMRITENHELSAADRAQLAVQAWLEIDDIERRFQRHTCNLDTSYGFQGKEVLFSMRMLTSNQFQNFIPQVSTNGSVLFYRDKAEAWLRYIDEVGEWIWMSLSDATMSPSQDHRKSLLIYWFISNIRKAVALWRDDPGLSLALTVSRTCAERAEYLMRFWPNMRLREIWQKWRMDLVEACLRSGIAPPSAAIPHIPTFQAAST